MPSKHGHLHLRDNYFSPGRVLRQGGIDPIIRGMIMNFCQEVDTKAVDGVRNFLFGTNTKGFDLVSINIQRGRDHGIPDYNTLRKGLGLAYKTSFEEITSDRNVSEKMKYIYQGDINNIDAFVGGLAEPHVSGGAVGELFATIIADQFYRLRNGDRHWFENNLNMRQCDISKIRKTSMAEVISRNSGVDSNDKVWTYRFIKGGAYRKHRTKLKDICAFKVPNSDTISQSIHGKVGSSEHDDL